MRAYPSDAGSKPYPVFDAAVSSLCAAARLAGPITRTIAVATYAFTALGTYKSTKQFQFVQWEKLQNAVIKLFFAKKPSFPMKIDLFQYFHFNFDS